MKSSLQAMRSAVGVSLGLLLLSTAAAQNAPSGYQPPNFQAIAQSYQAASRPTLPASPLAGGVSAANGNAFMDAHGNSIVMPASYEPMGEGGPGGQGGCAACAGAGYGDPAAIDFGGYGADQSGPHYFDVSAGVVYLRGEQLFDDVPLFTSVGVGGNVDPDRSFLDPANDYRDYEPGWQIAARYDLGPLSFFEGAYMGLYDIGFQEQVRSVDVTDPSTDFQLFSVFSNYGTGTLIPGIDDGSVHSLHYKSDLQSTELSYRRYWVGANPRVTGTYLLGFRYLRMTEDLTFNSQALAGSASRLWSSENNLVGFQLGGDGWITLRQGLRLGGEVKTGIYNNRFQFRHAGDFPGTTSDFSSQSKGNQVAFAAEGGVTVVADILPSWSLRGGYQVLYLNSLATAGNNVDPSNINSTAVLTQADALYHGFHAGLEYVW